MGGVWKHDAIVALLPVAPHRVTISDKTFLQEDRENTTKHYVKNDVVTTLLNEIKSLSDACDIKVLICQVRQIKTELLEVLSLNN